MENEQQSYGQTIFMVISVTKIKKKSLKFQNVVLESP